MFSIEGMKQKWFHNHGIKMKLESLNLTTKRIVISASAAKLTISKAKKSIDKATGWVIRWEVVQSYPSKIKATGKRIFSDEELKSAFGLSNKATNAFSQWMINRYGADIAHQGKFIRLRDYLSIPGPGTGHDGDPNISIEIDDQIQDAIFKLLN